MDYNFADVERVLATLHLIADEKRSAFANRLRHLQKMGFPPGTNTGRGRAAAYKPEHIFLLGVALELNQFGMTPERAVKLITQSLEEIASGVSRVVEANGVLRAILANPPANALAELTDGDDDQRFIQCRSAEQIGSFLDEIGAEHSAIGLRMAFFSITGLIQYLARQLSSGTEAKFYSELTAWAARVVEGSAWGELKSEFEQDKAERDGSS